MSSFKYRFGGIGSCVVARYPFHFVVTGGLKMGRAPRADVAGGIYHALNRSNARHDIFFKPQDFEAFERIVAEALSKFSVDLIAYQCAG